MVNDEKVEKIIRQLKKEKTIRINNLLGITRLNFLPNNVDYKNSENLKKSILKSELDSVQTLLTSKDAFLEKLRNCKEFLIERYLIELRLVIDPSILDYYEDSIISLMEFETKLEDTYNFYDDRYHKILGELEFLELGEN